MSVEAISWALHVPIGGTSKLVLIGLANHATAQFTESWPGVNTLATYANCDRRTVQRALRKLEDDGWISKTGEHPIKGRPDRVSYIYSLTGRQNVAPYGATSEDGATSTTGRGGASVANGAAPTPPEPSLEPSKGKPSELQAARTRDDWPAKLEDTATAQEVLDTLIEVAHEHGSLPPTRKAVGHLLLAFPDRAHLVEARKMASWWADKQVKRVAQTYRNWLEGADAVSVGVRNIKSAPSQKMEAKSKAERQTLQEWATANVPDLPVSRVMSAAQRIQYVGGEVTAERVRSYLERMS